MTTHLQGVTVRDGVVHGDTWVRSDAWVLAAVRLCGTEDLPGTLRELVVACSAVHHLIPSPAELEHAMGLLVGAGLVEVDARGFWVTPQGRTAVAEAGRSVRGPVRRPRDEALLEVLQQLPATPAPWVLDRAAYEAACLEYRHRVWLEYRRPHR